MHRVIHLTTLPQTAASFLHGQLGWLTKHDMDVTIMSSAGAQLEQFAEQEGVGWDTIELLRAIAPRHDALAVRRLASKFRQRKPDLVHAHTPKAGLVGMLAATFARVPCRVYHLHGLKFETARGLRRQILKQAEQTTCRLADRILCVSKSLQEKAIGEGLFPASKSRVLAGGSINGLDVDEFLGDVDPRSLREETRARFAIPTDATCLGFVGRLVRDKGVEDLHAAWQQLRDQYPDLHLLLVGPFEQQDPVEASIQESFERDARVHLTGLDWNVRPYFSAMDVFTLPSHREGLGHVLLEAAAMALPVVANRVTGCVDAVADGQTGTLIEPHCPNALSGAIGDYLDDPRLRRLHGEAGRERIRRQFRPQQIWQELLLEYQELLGRVPNPSGQFNARPLERPAGRVRKQAA